MKRNPILFALLATGTAAPGFASYSLSTLTSFNGTNGASPYGGLVLSADGNTLYGTTQNGGANNDGTVFSLPTCGGTPTTLASFNGTNGQYPRASLVLSGDGNTLYGTSIGDIADNLGTVFAVPTAGGTPTVLASFNGNNGSNLCGGLTLAGSTLYGTTSNGGNNYVGTVFAVPVSGGGGAPTTLASFNGTNGAYPSGAVTISSDGSTLYGTTSGDNVNNNGTVFSMPIGGGTPMAIATFTNGETPSGDLTVDAAGNLYGTTAGGGDNGLGTVFVTPPAGGVPTTLASFDGANGATPLAGLVLSGGTLYGTTSAGGANNYGTVFSMPASGGAPTVVAFFIGFNGAAPTCNLIADANGNLFGTTSSGGDSGYGTVFELALQSAPAMCGNVTIASGINQTTHIAGGSFNDPAGSVDATFASTTGVTLSITYDPALTLSDLLAGSQGILAIAPSFELPTGPTLEAWDVQLSSGSCSGETELVFHYDPSLLTPGINQSLLEIYHFTGGHWVAMSGIVNTANDTITVETPSFSPFALGLIQVVPEPTTTSLLGVGMLGLLARRRRKLADN